jgi:serine/threonine protein kinase
VTVFGYREPSTDSPYYFIDMELCDKSLDQYISDFHSTPDTNALKEDTATSIWNIMKDVTDGVSFIHSQSEIHRDLKPQNGIAMSYIVDN